MDEKINHPTHYLLNRIECIDAMEDCFGTVATQYFCLLNAFKYLWRCESKHDNPTDDIAKAQWYLDKWMVLEAKLNA